MPSTGSSLEAASLAATYVMTTVLVVADREVLGCSLASRIGVTEPPRTSAAPSKAYFPAIDLRHGLRNLEYPLDSEGHPPRYG